MRVNKAPKGMPVESWCVIGHGKIVVGGFETPEAAQAWATEWTSCKCTTVSPVCTVAVATEALTLYERHAQGLDSDEL